MNELEYRIVEAALLAHAKQLLVKLGEPGLDNTAIELLNTEYRATLRLISRAETRCNLLSTALDDLGLTL